MAEYSTLAAVDLGSNSFYCQVARVVGDQLYPLDSLREPVLLAAGLTADKLLDEPAQERARQTARAYAADVHTHEELGVGASATRILKTARWPDGSGSVLIVGHQPARGAAAALALTGKSAARPIKQGAIWWLRPSGGGPPLVVAVITPRLAHAAREKSRRSR